MAIDLKLINKLLTACLYSGVEPVVRLQGIAEQCRPGLDVAANLSLQFMLARRNRKGTHVASTLYHTQCNSLVLAARTCDNLLATGLVHIARLAADKLSSTSTLPAS